MADFKKRLAEKGWNNRDINNAMRIIENARKNRHPKIKILDSIVCWLPLIAATIGNFVIAVALLPLLLVFNNLTLYFLLITVGLSFGMLFELLIRSIEHLKAEHHAFLTIVVPLISAVNFMLIVLFSNKIGQIIKLENIHQPLTVGIIYSISFIAPYIIQNFHRFLK